ncbi:ARM repeat-containing protein [Schizophyllum commune H4-8]|uniref:Importin N-terminal domain-containing protein n=1 Tax=Schizophyllum commune (strain H4-8 / FGSC 9210) TaxID=578458 RepID=D8PPH6_SCHCM|nr:ARM repeat-containing protein [Schizophyllum commune H4-8]KAI5893425.1 ARM repeat-containing protein [Schizophyllum commune H4-8]
MNLGPRGVQLGVQTQVANPEEVFQVVQASTSQDVATMTAGSERLKALLEQQGAHAILLEIAAQTTLPLNVRQLAILQFKNHIGSRWRNRRLLTDGHRTHMRTLLLSFLDETDETIASCVEEVLGKISRSDYPSQWPNLLETLMQVVYTEFPKRSSMTEENPAAALRLRRALRLIYKVVKQFYSQRLLAGVRVMASIIAQLHAHLSQCYTQLLDGLSASSINEIALVTPRIQNDIVISHVLFKILNTMHVWIFQKAGKPGEDASLAEWANAFFQHTIQEVRHFVALRSSFVASVLASNRLSDAACRKTMDLLVKRIKGYGKFYFRLAMLNPGRFVELPSCTDMIMFYWTEIEKATEAPPQSIADSNYAPYPVRFLVQGMMLFRISASQWKPRNKDGTPNPREHLSREFVENAVRFLVTRFMPLNPHDLESWSNDPEEWVNAEDKENDQWEFEIRPCSERVLVTLCNQYPEVVTPLLQAAFKDIAYKEMTDLQGVVQKEAIYCAIGRCCHKLKEAIPFAEWAQKILVAEATSTNPTYPILKRRIAWLIGQWVSSGMTSPNNSTLWELLVHLLGDRSQGTDAVVRLTAVEALRQCVDTLEFDPTVFQPFLPRCIEELLRMLGEAETQEGKNRVAKALNTVIAQCKKNVVPFISMIAQPIPQLWTESEQSEDASFKATLLETVTSLVNVVKEESTPLAPLVVPLVKDALTTKITTFVDEDGFELLHSALRNTTSIWSVNGGPCLADLFPVLIAYLADNLDILGRTVQCLESFYLLDAPGLLQRHAMPLFEAYLQALNSDAVCVNNCQMIGSLALLVRLAPAPLWGEALHTSGLFAKLLRTLMDGEVETLLLIEHVFLFSRIVLADRQVFVTLMTATAEKTGMAEDKLYELLLDQWWGKFDNMGEPWNRKLTAMGIASLVATGKDRVLKRLSGEVFNIWLDCFGEIKEAQTEASEPGEFSHGLRRMWENEDAPEKFYAGSEDTVEYERRKALYEHDPVRTAQLTAFVKACMDEVALRVGPQQLEGVYLKDADQAVLREIYKNLGIIA